MRSNLNFVRDPRVTLLFGFWHQIAHLDSLGKQLILLLRAVIRGKLSGFLLDKDFRNILVQLIEHIGGSFDQVLVDWWQTFLIYSNSGHTVLGG